MDKTLFSLAVLLLFPCCAVFGQLKRTATFESDSAVSERNQFINYNSIQKVKAVLFDHTKTENSNYSIKLPRSTKSQLATSLAVNAGDTVYAEVYVKYLTQDEDRNSHILLLPLLGKYIIKPTLIEGIHTPIFTRSNPIYSFIGAKSSSDPLPAAYLNYLVFDKQFNLIDAGFIKASSTAKETGQNGTHEKLSLKVKISTPGFVYVYISDESSNSEVFFDDFTVNQLQAINIITESGQDILAENGDNVIGE